MTKNIIFLFFFFNIVGKMSYSQQKSFELEGEIRGLTNGKIELRETIIKKITIECIEAKKIIVNENFNFSGKITNATEVRLLLNDTIFSKPFFLESGKQRVLIKLDSFNNPLEIIGSKSNKEYLSIYFPTMNSYEDKKQIWYDDLWALEKKYNQRIPVSVKDSMENILRDINNQKDYGLQNFIKFHTKSQIGLWNLYRRVYTNGYSSIYDTSYFLLDKHLKISKTGQLIKKLLDNGRKLSIGKSFPVIKAFDMHKNFVTVLPKNNKRFTLIDFWFSGCLPCIRQFEELNNLYSKYESKGFEIFGISIDKKEDEKKFQNILISNGIKWPQYWDIDGKQVSTLNISTFPSNLLIDTDGKIIAKNIEPFQLERFLIGNIDIPSP